MWMLALIPFFLQGVAIAIDEKVFHYRRGLPQWERIGHPLDTLSQFACMAFVLFVPFSIWALKVYCGLAFFSCLLVTKDEFVHKDHCPGAENWLHACLFILHPITLAMTGLIWPVIQGVEVSAWITAWLNQPSYLELFLQVQAALVFLYFLYQVIFWNFIWHNTPVIKE